MRAFIVLCLVAAACADNVGYNYHPGGPSEFGISSGGSTGHVSGGSHGVVGNIGSGVGVAGNFGSVSGGSGIVGSAGIASGGLVSNGVVGTIGVNGNGGSVIGSGPGTINGGVSYTPQVELEKEFYTFTANENDFSSPHIENQIANYGKKGLRVIFIKGPEHNGVENAAVALAKHIAEQKTAIYVLQKQTDLGSLTQKLNTINSNINHKPEVHFVKYRTNEDAITAQKSIQSQYDSLGGVTHNYSGGEAPVLNFASNTPLTSQGSHGSFAPISSVSSTGPHVSFGSTGSLGNVVSTGTFESTGSVGSSGVSAPSTSYIPPSPPSSTYLPA